MLYHVNGKHQYHEYIISDHWTTHHQQQYHGGLRRHCQQFPHWNSLMGHEQSMPWMVSNKAHLCKWVSIHDWVSFRDGTYSNTKTRSKYSDRLSSVKSANAVSIEEEYDSDPFQFGFPHGFNFKGRCQKPIINEGRCWEILLFQSQDCEKSQEHTAQGYHNIIADCTANQSVSAIDHVVCQCNQTYRDWIVEMSSSL